MARITKFRKQKFTDERDNERRFQPVEPDAKFDGGEAWCEQHFSPADLCSDLHTPVLLRIERHLTVVK